MATIYTIGHSHRSIDELMQMLIDAGIQTLVDIRSYPVSQRFPHFSADALRPVIEQHGIIYHLAGRQLGGKRKALAHTRHSALTGSDLQGFADYTDSDEFKRSINQLLGLAGRSNTAILCAEKDPMTCHRQIIADYLILNGHDVIHLIDTNTTQTHQLSTAVRRESADLVYDAQASLF